MIAYASILMVLLSSFAVFVGGFLIIVVAGWSASIISGNFSYLTQAWQAALIQGVACFVTFTVEWFLGGKGSLAVATFWGGTGFRALVLIVSGALGAGPKVNGELSEAAKAWWLWLLLSYIVFLIIEVFWLVRRLDQQSKVKSNITS